MSSIALIEAHELLTGTLRPADGDWVFEGEVRGDVAVNSKSTKSFDGLITITKAASDTNTDFGIHEWHPHVDQYHCTAEGGRMSIPFHVPKAAQFPLFRYTKPLTSAPTSVQTPGAGMLARASVQWRSPSEFELKVQIFRSHAIETFTRLTLPLPRKCKVSHTCTDGYVRKVKSQLLDGTRQHRVVWMRRGPLHAVKPTLITLSIRLPRPLLPGQVPLPAILEGMSAGYPYSGTFVHSCRLAPACVTWLRHVNETHITIRLGSPPAPQVVHTPHVRPTTAQAAALPPSAPSVACAVLSPGPTMVHMPEPAVPVALTASAEDVNVFFPVEGLPAAKCVASTSTARARIPVVMITEGEVDDPRGPHQLLRGGASTAYY